VWGRDVYIDERTVDVHVGRLRSSGSPTCTVRVTIKLRAGEYDELSRHVREIGSTMSCFLRESAVKAMKDGPQAAS
jgi:hypothetical protein